MQKNNKKVLSICLLFVLITITLSATIAPASANTLEVPEGFKIIYYTRGSANIEVPSSWPSGGQPTTMLRIVATHIEAGDLGKGDTIFVYSYNPVSPMGPWVPVALFTTSQNALTFYRTVWSGAPVAATTNSKLVSETALNVERHGNRIIAELTAPQTIMWAKIGGGFTSITIPAFTVNLNGVGWFQLTKTSTTLEGYTGASHYTLNDYQLGFNAKGAFTCQAWGYTAKSMTDCAIVMLGIRTYVPP